MTENIKIPPEVEPEPPAEARHPGDGHHEWSDYQLDREDHVPEESGYGYGV